jgi:hypothetical protein
LVSSFLVGIDLGQVADPTAVVILERRQESGRPHYECRHLERLPLGTPYLTGRDWPVEARGVGERLRALFAQPVLRDCQAAIDETGVGRAVVDALRTLRLGIWLRPVTVTAGLRLSQEADGSCCVPKRDLVGTVQALLGQNRLTIAAALPLTPVLLTELANYRIKITAAGHETFSGDWRCGQHDDLVFALALACWIGERYGGGDPRRILSGGGVGKLFPPGTFAATGRAEAADARKLTW